MRRAKPRLIIELHPTYVPNTEEICKAILREAGYSRFEKVLQYRENEYLSVEA